MHLINSRLGRGRVDTYTTAHCNTKRFILESGMFKYYGSKLKEEAPTSAILPVVKEPRKTPQRKRHLRRTLEDE